MSSAGFESLFLSVWAARKLFGEHAEYAVCINSIGAAEIRASLGPLPDFVQWIDSSAHIPGWLTAHLDPAMAEGVAWKLTPVRVFPNSYEISLDNDVIMWGIPRALRKWLACDDPSACLMCADTQRCFGQFASRCEAGALNSGIRGVAPGFDLEHHLRTALSESGITLRSELDEQGLQATVLSQFRLFVIPNEDVTICSPFPTHQQRLGRCGAHFVGLNVKQSPWLIDGRQAHEVIQERWQTYRTQIHRRVLTMQMECESPKLRHSMKAFPRRATAESSA